MPLRLPRLESASDAPFPSTERALVEPNGLLAFGGDLTPTRLLNAYRGGIFPWYSDGEPILWWSPDPRMVITPPSLHLSQRLRRTLRRCDWQVRCDQRFDDVIAQCADLPRHGRTGTWITDPMRAAYTTLHRLGHAHSVEVCDANGSLVGGLYGIAIGRMFFGESMFSRRSGGSQVAVAALCRRLQEWDFALLDGQVHSAHLATLGFRPLPRREFVETCRLACAGPALQGSWQSPFGAVAARELA